MNLKKHIHLLLKGRKGQKVNQLLKQENRKKIRKQRLVIHPDQIGDCDDTQDPDYR